MSRANPDTYTLTHLDVKELTAELYSRYGQKLYGYAVKRWHVNEDAAWELVYKTLYKTIDTYKKYDFDNEDRFAAFIFRIFINYLKNHYRDNRHMPRVETDAMSNGSLDNVATPQETEAVNNHKLTLLNEELENMEDWQRVLLLMRSDGKSYAEIAAYVDRPEDQLKVYYQRLKQRITQKLNERL